MRKLLVSAIVTPDGTRLESNHRHDYKSHLDANGETYIIDGGLDYVRRSVNKEPATDAFVYTDDPHETKRTMFKWGTYGRGKNKKLEWKPLESLDTDHIEAILKTQHHIGEAIKKLFVDELSYRKTILNEENN
jgi:hypothetical protein